MADEYRPPRFEPFNEADHRFDVPTLLPYSRTRERGRIIRVETDGNGGLVEFVETSSGDVVWGETRGSWQELREAAPDRELVSRTGGSRDTPNVEYLYEQRLERFRSYLALLEENGPMTREQVRDRLGLGRLRVDTDLDVLENRFLLKRITIDGSTYYRINGETFASLGGTT